MSFSDGTCSFLWNKHPRCEFLISSTLLDFTDDTTERRGPLAGADLR